jgi:serine/threonine-protein kinase
MTVSSPKQAAPDRDEVLARLLTEMTDRTRRGQPPDLEKVIAEFPDLAQELRPLWAAVQVAENLARPATVATAPTIDRPGANGANPGKPLAGFAPRTVGDFELLEELGRGGMGVVYKAWQKSLDRIVALKMILRGELASAADIARFRAEAEAAARLAHPNIVAVHGFEECDGQAFFSMEYVEGQTLAQRVAAGPFPPREAAQLLATVARAVHHAHQHGILHRDLKPSNVLLKNADCRFEIADFKSAISNLQSAIPMITDFGLAKRVEGGASLTRSGAIVGTPSYMAPEQITGSRGTMGPRSDVYSLGVILYELLTGRPPFQAASAVDTLMLVLEQDVVPPRLLNGKVDRDLELICLKCLQKPPDLRYGSAQHLAEDLEAFLHGETISARPSGLAYFVGRMLRETHHAPVLENWGLLWMWHSLQIFLLCAVTSAMAQLGVDSHEPYLILWSVGLVAWGAIFWALRRRGGPVTFVERQIAHLWASGVVGSIIIFVVEWMLGLKVLTLSPVMAVIAGMVFLGKAGILSGEFYLWSGAMFLTAGLMVLVPDVGLILFGIVSAASFFCPGLKYHRQRIRARRSAK